MNANDFLVQHLNSIVHGDNMEIMKQMPDDCVDLIFADPPYNMGMKKLTVLDNSYRGGKTQYVGVTDEWDNIGDQREYEAYTKKWLTACRRILAPNGSIFVIGNRHCIYSIVYIARRLGYKFIQDIVWYKMNNRPNIHTRSLLHQHEIVAWLAKDEKSKHTFNYHTAKRLGIRTPRGTVELTQAGSVWQMPICGKGDRLYNEDGKAFHSTQKPWNLVRNIVLMASNENDLVFDPFSGSGTTCAVAKAHSRKYLGVEKTAKYIDRSRERVQRTEVVTSLETNAFWDKSKAPRKPRPTTNRPRRQVPYKNKK